MNTYTVEGANKWMLCVWLYEHVCVPVCVCVLLCVCVCVYDLADYIFRNISKYLRMAHCH